MSNGAPPTFSGDGRWWWDGSAWRPTFVAPTSPPAGPPATGRRRRRTVTVVLLGVGAYVLLIGFVLGTLGWAVTRGNPSMLGDFRIFMATSARPEIVNYYVGGMRGRTTVVFAVRLSQGSGTDPAALLPEARALQSIVNREVPGYDGPVFIRFRENRHVVETVSFQAHDVLDVDTTDWQP